MAFLISGGGASSEGFRTFAVGYTATGSEGTDFTVTLQNAMANTSYSVFAANAGGTSGDGSQSSGVDVIDLPVASRTQTAFRVVLGASLAAGDQLQFLVAGVVA